MLALVAALLAQPAVADEPEVEILFEQVHPVEGDTPQRTDDTERAVVLIHGYFPAYSYASARNAKLHRWQKSGSKLVDALGEHGDVYSIGYGQDAPIDAIADQDQLTGAIESLEAAGYDEITVVGHSAGGLLARVLVEEHPGLGVDRVVQVCPANGGAGLSELYRVSLRPQESFVASMAKRERTSSKPVPADVELVSVVCEGGGIGDGVLSDTAQWPPDLREQGVPMVRLSSSHFTPIRSDSGVSLITELATTSSPRWTPEEVEAALEGEWVSMPL